MATQQQAAEVVRAQQAEESYSRAHGFFRTRARLTAAAAPTESIANNLGTVQFHLIGQKPTDPKYSDIMNQNADNLLAIGGLVHDYMTRTYPTVNSQKPGYRHMG